MQRINIIFSEYNKDYNVLGAILMKRSQILDIESSLLQHFDNYMIFVQFLQSTSTSVSKSIVVICQSKGFKNNFTIYKRERIVAISKHTNTILMYMNSLCWTEMFPAPSFSVESYMRLLLFIS